MNLYCIEDFPHTNFYELHFSYFFIFYFFGDFPLELPWGNIIYSF